MQKIDGWIATLALGVTGGQIDRSRAPVRIVEGISAQGGGLDLPNLDRSFHGGGPFPRNFITCCRSDHSRLFSLAVRSTYAGGNDVISRMPSISRHVPRMRVIGVW